MPDICRFAIETIRLGKEATHPSTDLTRLESQENNNSLQYRWSFDLVHFYCPQTDSVLSEFGYNVSNTIVTETSTRKYNHINRVLYFSKSQTPPRNKIQKHRLDLIWSRMIRHFGSDCLYLNCFQLFSLGSKFQSSGCMVLSNFTGHIIVRWPDGSGWRIFAPISHSAASSKDISANRTYGPTTRGSLLCFHRYLSKIRRLKPGSLCCDSEPLMSYPPRLRLYDSFRWFYKLPCVEGFSGGYLC